MSETPTAPTAPVLPDVCTMAVLVASYAGEACPGCGHTNIAHPGVMNPALTECVLCRVVVSVAELRQDVVDLVTTDHAADVRLVLVEGRASTLEARVDVLEGGPAA